MSWGVGKREIIFSEINQLTFSDEDQYNGVVSISEIFSMVLYKHKLIAVE